MKEQQIASALRLMRAGVIIGGGAALLATVTGCVGRGYYAVKKDPHTLGQRVIAEHQFREPRGLKPIAGNSYPIPQAARQQQPGPGLEHGQRQPAKSEPVPSQSTSAKRLPARTEDSQRISILPPGAKL